MRMGAPDEEFDSGDETFDVVGEDAKLMADVEKFITYDVTSGMAVEIEDEMVDDTTSTKTTIKTD